MMLAAGAIGNPDYIPQQWHTYLLTVALLVIHATIASFHLSEECSNANIASPRAIVMTSTLGGILGWFIILVIGYTVQDIGAVVGSDLGQPMGSYLLQVLGPKGGVGLFSLVIISCFFM